jgi:hypothetical protein
MGATLLLKRHREARFKSKRVSTEEGENGFHNIGEM